jgi:hypothetical protein
VRSKYKKGFEKTGQQDQSCIHDHFAVTLAG